MWVVSNLHVGCIFEWRYITYYSSVLGLFMVVHGCLPHWMIVYGDTIEWDIVSILSSWFVHIALFGLFGVCICHICSCWLPCIRDLVAIACVYRVVDRLLIIDEAAQCKTRQGRNQEGVGEWLPLRTSSMDHTDGANLRKTVQTWEGLFLLYFISFTVVRFGCILF